MVVSNPPSTSSLNELGGDKLIQRKMKELVGDVENLAIINFNAKIEVMLLQKIDPKSMAA